MSTPQPWRPPLALGLLITTELGLWVTVLRAMVIAHLWQWFGADPFGLPRVGVVPVAGLLLIWGFLAGYIGRDGGRDLTGWTDLLQRFFDSLVPIAAAFASGLLLVQVRGIR